MAYIGKTPSSGEIIILDNIENGFNGSTTAFNLTRTVQGQTTAFYPQADHRLLVSLGGVIQEPDPTGNTGFTINFNTIVFAIAPPAGVNCFIIALGTLNDIGQPSDGTVTSDKIQSPGPTWDANGNTTINATGYLDIAVGTTLERPSSPNSGMIRYNTTNQQFEGYGASWGGFGGASGSAGDAVFYENDPTVTADYSITSGKNAMSAGPITINNGVTVTIPTGSNWTVV